jgi:hypothetical protein
MPRPHEPRFMRFFYDEDKLDKMEFLDLNRSNAVLMFASF